MGILCRLTRRFYWRYTSYKGHNHSEFKNIGSKHFWKRLNQKVHFAELMSKLTEMFHIHFQLAQKSFNSTGEPFQ